MHAQWWDRSALRSYGWLSDRPTSMPTELAQERFLHNIDSFLKIAEDHVPDGVEEIARKLTPTIPMIASALAEPPVTLVHGDFRLANIFFDDSSGDRGEVVALDWQLVARIKAAHDVGAFIMQSLATESRRRHEMELLSLYHSSLVDRGVRDYSFDEFQSDVRMAVLPRLVVRVNVVAGVSQKMLATADGRMRLMGMVERLQTLIDWNCEEVIPK